MDIDDVNALTTGSSQQYCTTKTKKRAHKNWALDAPRKSKTSRKRSDKLWERISGNCFSWPERTNVSKNACLKMYDVYAFVIENIHMQFIFTFETKEKWTSPASAGRVKSSTFFIFLSKTTESAQVQLLLSRSKVGLVHFSS